ncbi:hypothetical protein ACIBCR_14760 [Micromonospora echinospora]|uniref:hypothetical protein n=1 Tax=Micromonospora echinospora TaxID=1877 RepID=UPI0037947D72
MLIEVYPSDVLVAFLVLLVVALLPVGMTAWAMRPDRRQDCTECAATVELPARRPMRTRRRPPHTGVVHVSRPTVPDDAPTVVLPVVDGDR